MLAEKQAAESAEAAEKERKVELREQLKARMKAWQQVRTGPAALVLAGECSRELIITGVIWASQCPSLGLLVNAQKLEACMMEACPSALPVAHVACVVYPTFSVPRIRFAASGIRAAI